MNNDEPTDRSALLDATFAASLAGEPPLTLDLDAIQRRGARRQRRRRTWAVGGVAAAVVSLTAGIAVALPGLESAVRTAAPAAIPGCQTVLRTTDPAYLSWQDEFLGGTDPASAITAVSAATAAVSSAVDSAVPLSGSASTADATHPTWFTLDKAAAMSKALLAALPASAELGPAAANGKTPDPLPFTPAAGPGGSGLLQLGQNRAVLQLGVQSGNRGAGDPPCIETMALRYTAPDGTVVDVISGTTPGTESGAGPYLVADAVHPDGTWVNAYLSVQQPINASTRLPINAAQLARIVAAPGLSITD